MKSQPPSKTASARALVAKGSLDAPSNIHSSRSSSNRIPGNAPRNKQSGVSGAAQALNISESSHTAEKDSIYDLPSSDDEDHLIVRHKRRRQDADTNGNAKLSRYPLAVRSPPEPEASVAIQDIPVNPDPPEPRTKVDSPRATRHVYGRGRPRPQNIDTRSRSPPEKSTEASFMDISQESNAIHLVSRDTSRQLSQSKEKQAPNEGAVSGPSREPGSPPPRIHASAWAGSTTPTRRRLIDSLGARERSTDASSNIAPGSQSSSPCTPQSPSRPKAFPPATTRTNSQITDPGQETVAVSPHLTGSKVTYARQRSFLDDLASMTGELSGPNIDASFEKDGLSTSQARRFNDLPRARLFEIEEVNNDDGSVRNIHELRRAGGNARYRGAIESIFEDIEDPQVSVSGRCNSFLRLCDKLLEPKLARQFVECNFDRRLVDCLSGKLDMFSATLGLCVFGLASLGRSLPYVLAAAAWPKLLDISPTLLGVQGDFCATVRARDSDLSKAAQTLVQSMAPRIHAALFPDISGPTLSPCLLALHCSRVTIAAFQAKGEKPNGLPAPMLKQLVKILLSESSHLEKKGTSGEDGLHVLIMGLSILEVHITSKNPIQEDQLDALSVLCDMHCLLRLNKDANATRQQVQTLYLRVILNTTNSNPKLCDKLATAAMIEELATIAMARFGDLTEDTLAQENNPLDTVILALGALINLVEQSEASRTMFLKSGSVQQTILDQLLRLYLAHVDSISKVGPHLTLILT